MMLGVKAGGFISCFYTNSTVDSPACGETLAAFQLCIKLMFKSVTL